MNNQRKVLTEWFAERLLAVHPGSVLDVGCGTGRLLARCREKGVTALGVELAPRDASALQHGGLPALCAAAERLPFRPRAFDWVILRHVAHHLADPAAALREAWRVANSGVMVAEPWFDPGAEDQRHALEFDLWLKRLHRRAGRIHRDNLSAEELLAALPRSGALAHVETTRPACALSEEDLRAEGDPALEAAGAEAGEREHYQRFLRLARSGHLSANGSLLLTARRDRRAVRQAEQKEDAC